MILLQKIIAKYLVFYSKGTLQTSSFLFSIFKETTALYHFCLLPLTVPITCWWRPRHASHWQL